MGGNTDRVYTVNPKHMRVNYPHYHGDSDPVSHSYGALAETAVLHMTVRIRLGELSREMVDALPLGSGEVDTLSFSKVAALDKCFEQILRDIPFLEISSITVDAASRRVAVQRAIGLLSVHSRRARFLRPFIQLSNIPEKFDVFRRHCLNAAQTVVDLASTLLSESISTPGQAESYTQAAHNRSHVSNYDKVLNQSGIIINHVRGRSLTRICCSFFLSTSDLGLPRAQLLLGISVTNTQECSSSLRALFLLQIPHSRVTQRTQRTLLQCQASTPQRSGDEPN